MGIKWEHIFYKEGLSTKGKQGIQMTSPLCISSQSLQSAQEGSQSPSILRP